MYTTRLVKLPTNLLWNFREFKRNEMPAPYCSFVFSHSVDEVTEYVREHGIEPLELSVVNDKALLTDGNHRIVAAERLGLEEIPVKVNVYEGDGIDSFYNHTLERFVPLTKPMEAYIKLMFL